MKLNNKGITLVEIIIAIALISIVLLFLFILLVNVNDINEESELNSSYLINKSLIIKNIEEDLNNSTAITISNCINDVTSIYDIQAFYEGYGTEGYFDENEKNKANECLKLEYDGDTEPAYIAVYYYDNRDSYVISYIHGTTKSTRLLEEFEKYNVTTEGITTEGKIKESLKMYITLSDGTQIDYDSLSNISNDGFVTITIPIIGPDEKDYSIIIPYYGTVTVSP